MTDVVKIKIGGTEYYIKDHQTDSMPKEMDSTETGPDLDVADQLGNVLMRLEDGHIKTKAFDSSALSGLFDEKQDVLTFDDAPTASSNNPVKSGGVYSSLLMKQDRIIEDSEETAPDFDITDNYGNVIARLQDGGIETKKFKGFEYILFKSSETAYDGTACTLTVEHAFHAGDRIVLHVERGAKPWSYGGQVTYKADDTVLLNSTRGDNAYLEYTLTQDADEIKAIYAASATGVTNGDRMTLEVYLMGDIPVKPKVISVKKDGTGDYTTLRGAIEAIGTKADDVIHPYRIEIYPGAYDVMDDYTAAEINAASYDPGTDGFVGPKLLNGVSLVGMGDPNKIILTAALDPDEYSSSVRGAISTLNTQGSMTLENLTVIATDIRYCVHDDFAAPLSKRKKRLVKNCVFRAYGTTVANGEYGAATGEGGMDFLFEDCDFGGSCGVHNQSLMRQMSTVTLRHCRGTYFGAYDYDQGTSDKVNYEIYLYGCGFRMVTSSKAPTAEQNIGHIRFHSSDANAVYWSIPKFDQYIAGNVEISEPIQNVQAGRLMKRTMSSFKLWETASTAAAAQGIAIYAGDDLHIQTSGIVRSDRIGITGAQFGDYIGVDSNGYAAIVQSAADAFGKVVRATSSVAYIELNWR